MQKTYLPRQKILNVFPDQKASDLLNKIINKYQEMVNSYFLEDFQSVLLHVGKFDELMLLLLNYLVEKQIPSKPSFDKTEKILHREVSNNSIPPSLLNFLFRGLNLSYKFRNSRDGAHISDIISNQIDSLLVIEISQWCIAELIRTYSNLSIKESCNLIKEIIEYPTPLIQRFNEKTIVLCKTSASNEILLILFFQKGNKLEEKELKAMITEHSNHSVQNVITSLRNLEKSKKVFRNEGISYLTNNGKKAVINLIQVGGL